MIRIRIRTGLALWIWIRTEIKSWIRIRIKTNADPQPRLQLLSFSTYIPVLPLRLLAVTWSRGFGRFPRAATPSIFRLHTGSNYSSSMCQLLPGVGSSAASLELQLPALSLTVDVLPQQVSPPVTQLLRPVSKLITSKVKSTPLFWKHKHFQKLACPKVTPYGTGTGN